MTCYAFSHEHKTAAWVFAADEWCKGIWFEKDGPPVWAQAEPYAPANPQAASLYARRLISQETATNIDRECGADGDIGLFLGHLLSTGQITAEAVQAHLDGGVSDAE